MSSATEVKVPDIGDFDDVPIIEVHVKTGDQVNEEDPLVTLESDKATMDVPSPMSGVVRDVPVKIGDRVSEGALILTVEPGDGAVTPPPTLVEQQEPEPQTPRPPARAPAEAVSTEPAPAPVHAGTGAPERDFTGVHAGPSVRRLARELGLDLTDV